MVPRTIVHNTLSLNSCGIYDGTTVRRVDLTVFQFSSSVTVKQQNMQDGMIQKNLPNYVYVVCPSSLCISCKSFDFHSVVSSQTAISEHILMLSTVAFIASLSRYKQSAAILNPAYFILLFQVIYSAHAFKTKGRIYHSNQIAGELSFNLSSSPQLPYLCVDVRVYIDTHSVLCLQFFPPRS